MSHFKLRSRKFFAGTLCGKRVEDRNAHERECDECKRNQAILERQARS